MAEDEIRYKVSKICRKFYPEQPNDFFFVFVCAYKFRAMHTINKQSTEKIKHVWTCGKGRINMDDAIEYYKFNKKDTNLTLI